MNYSARMPLRPGHPQGVPLQPGRPERGANDRPMAGYALGHNPGHPQGAPLRAHHPPTIQQINAAKGRQQFRAGRKPPTIQQFNPGRQAPHYFFHSFLFPRLLRGTKRAGLRRIGGAYDPFIYCFYRGEGGAPSLPSFLPSHAPLGEGRMIIRPYRNPVADWVVRRRWRRL